MHAALVRFSAFAIFPRSFVFKADNWLAECGLLRTGTLKEKRFTPEKNISGPAKVYGALVKGN
jgi:hypothetical protein